MLVDGVGSGAGHGGTRGVERRREYAGTLASSARSRLRCRSYHHASLPLARRTDWAFDQERAAAATFLAAAFVVEGAAFLVEDAALWAAAFEAGFLVAAFLIAGSFASAFAVAVI